MRQDYNFLPSYILLRSICVDGKISVKIVFRVFQFFVFSCGHDRNLGIYGMRLDFCVWYFLAIQYLMLSVKGHIPPCTKCLGIQERNGSSYGVQQHIVIIFLKRKYYALEIGLLFSLMIWRFLTIEFMMLIGFDFM